MKIPISVDGVRKQYLYPLANMGVINSTRSVINRSENLYSPVEDSIFSLFDDDRDFRLKILDHRLYPSRNVLEDEYSIFVKDDAKGGRKWQFSKVQDTRHRRYRNNS